MEQVKCKYCGEVFEGETKIEAETKEGVHRTEEHVENEGNISKTGKDTNQNMVNKWKKNSEEA